MYNPYIDNRSEQTFLSTGEDCPVACLQKKKKGFSVKFLKLLHPKIAGIIMLAFLTAPGANAQQATDYAVHANIIYHFTKYIDWPDSKKTGDFIIGIIGDSPLYDELKTSVLNKKAGKQKIVIKKFPASASSFNCHILFISEEESAGIKKIDSKTANSSVLLVSESEGLAKKGACINFILIEDHLKLEINKNSIEERGMGIASELLQLGKIIK